jgi:hypothetical protein
VTAAHVTAWPACVLTITHRYGDNITVHDNQAGAIEQLAEFARQWWHEILDYDGRIAEPDEPAAPQEPPADDAETIHIYFARQRDEWWEITEIPTARIDPDGEFRLVPRVVIEAMAAIVNYSWQSEQADYAECGDPPRGNGNSRDGHVFRHLQLVGHWLDLTAGGPDAITVCKKEPSPQPHGSR